MQRLTVLRCASAGAVVLLASLGAATVSHAGGAWQAYELEHARAKARAGGPISDYDAELLERWGNSTGGPDWRKQYQADKRDRERAERRYRSKSKSRVYYD